MNQTQEIGNINEACTEKEELKAKIERLEKRVERLEKELQMIKSRIVGRKWV
ncbi:MAG: hypothetical protein QW304_07330 [Thermoproteota archaeon]